MKKGTLLKGVMAAALAAAMMGINAAKGFELGSGFGGSKLKGSEHNDIFENVDGNIIIQI